MTYRERREARAEKLRDWSDKRTQSSSAALKRSHEMMGAIPFGQPILVGHYSEKRDRRYRDRAWNLMGKGVEDSKKAASMASRADNIESALDRAIYDDDPDAIERLEEKLAGLEAKRERIKAENKDYRFVGTSRWDRDGRVGKIVGQRTGFLTLQFGDGTTQEVPRKQCHPAQSSYVLGNLGGTITVTRKRIAHLKARAQHVATRSSYETADGATVSEAAWAAYCEVAYPEKPSREIIDELKAAGFHWSRGAWYGERAKLPERYREETAA